MMTETQHFFIDTLNLIPFEYSSILINSPHIEVLNVIEKISYKTDTIYHSIQLDRKNRQILIFDVLYNNIEEYVHSLKIIINEKKIFEGYDGMEYGVFSKEFNLPKEFKEKYIAMDMCMISKDW